MTWSTWAPWVQIYTADHPNPTYHRRGLTMEPMSCPPNTFNTAPDSVVLLPAKQHRAEWCIRVAN